MINEITKERELCYVVKVNEIRPIEGRDRVECAVVNGWTCMVPKGVFQPGSLGIYFEIDSKVDTSRPEFAFTEKYHGKIKTQKFKTPNGHFISQGLLMAAKDFGWTLMPLDRYPDTKCWISTEGRDYYVGDFLTQELGVTYADVDDNKRKAKSADKYKLMMNRHPKLAKSKFGRWAMKHEFMKKLLFLFLGRKRDKRSGWPAWVVKTDEERIQNLVSRIPEFAAERWIATEKVDGTSTTFTMKGFGRKRQFMVCSRNVVFDKPDKKCFYDTNVYTEMAEKYNMEKVLADILDKNKADLEFVTIQGETFGGNIQKRDYSTQEHFLRVFNVIFGYKDGHTKRFNPNEMVQLMEEYDVPCVPVFGEVVLPNTCDGILGMAGGPSAIDGLPREGLVFRSLDGVKSFKAVDNEFLLQYHR